MPTLYQLAIAASCGVAMTMAVLMISFHFTELPKEKSEPWKFEVKDGFTWGLRMMTAATLIMLVKEWTA